MVKEEKFLLDKSTGKEIDIKQSDFEFVQHDSKIYDTKFNSKATTFFKDSIKRFVKSKSAITGGAIVGILILMSLIVPMCTSDVGAFIVDREKVGGASIEKNIQPKIFSAGTGWWDGTIKKTDIVYNEETKTPDGFREGTFSQLETYEKEVNSNSTLGRNGYVAVFCSDTKNNGNFSSPYVGFDLDNATYTINVEALDEQFTTYVKGEYRIVLEDSSKNSIVLNDYTTSTKVSASFSSSSIDLSSFSKNEEGKYNARIKLEVEANSTAKAAAIFKSVDISTSSDDKEEKELLDSISFENGNEVLNRDSSATNAWTTTSGRQAYRVQFTYCNFLFDQYESIYGEQEMSFGALNVIAYQSKNQIKINISSSSNKATTDKNVLKERFQIVGDDGLFVEIIEQEGDATLDSKGRWTGYTLKAIVRGYKYYGYDKMPKFIFGTNADSRDYFKLIFTSMRFSFLLAIGVSAVNIVVGLIWGSISGYFGGWTDIIMERIVEIIGSLPTTVIITLCIMYGKEWKWGSMSDVLALMVALFMTGWMGVAGRTRTQFYRFKGREYVLASRTLGAKDKRLIFRHILPNSMGTIITGSILMIPSVIYTEASIAYLGLGLSGQNMFGVILSEANSYYSGESTYLLLIPTCLMALLLISFNLFGNGLRDAFNPTLKGGDQ